MGAASAAGNEPPGRAEEPVEQVQIVNVNNGERLETYVIKGARGSGVVCLNGPAARRVQFGDVIIVCAYATMTPDEAKGHQPTLVFPDTATNSLT